MLSPITRAVIRSHLRDYKKEALKKDEFWSGEAFRAYASEFLGMFFFLWITIGGVASSNDTVSNFYGATNPDRNNLNQYGFAANMAMVLTVSLTFGMAIMVLVYGTAHVSGGHLNPAVTMSMIVFNEINPIRGLGYIVVQIAGAICGVAMVKALWPLRNTSVINLGANTLDTDLFPVQAFFLEFFGTALLVFTVFSTAIDARGSKFTHRLAPLAIGFTVFLVHVALIPMTGCGINPARSFASAVVSGVWEDHWVFWFAPMTGGPVGAALQFFIFQFYRESPYEGTGIMADGGGYDDEEQSLKVLSSQRFKGYHVPTRANSMTRMESLRQIDSLRRSESIKRVESFKRTESLNRAGVAAAPALVDEPGRAPSALLCGTINEEQPFTPAFDHAAMLAPSSSLPHTSSFNTRLAITSAFNAGAAQGAASAFSAGAAQAAASAFSAGAVQGVASALSTSTVQGTGSPGHSPSSPSHLSSSSNSKDV